MALIGSLTTTGSMQSLVVDEARWKVANDDGTSPGSVSLVIQTGDFGNAAQRNASGSIIFVGKDGGAISKAGSIVSKPYTNQDLIFSSSQSHADIRFTVNDNGNNFNVLTLTSGRHDGGLSGYRGPKVFITDTAAGYNKDVTLPYRGQGLLTVSTQTDQVGIQIIHTGSATEAALEIKKIKSANTNDSLFAVKPSETVINDDQTDYDFRVESDNESNMLYVDGTNNRIGIANNAPMAALDVNNRAAANWSIILRNSDNSGPASVYTGFKTNSNGVLIVTGTNGKLYLNAGKHSTNENAEMFLVSKTGLDGGTHGDSMLWFSKMNAAEAITHFAYMGYDHANSTIKMGGSSTFGASEWISANSSEVVINDDSSDIDFRVESNDKTNAFFVDGTNGKIQIGDDTTTGLGNYANVTINKTDTGTTWDSDSNSQNEISEMSLFIRNQSNKERTFAGIGFDVGTEIDVDSIGAAIIAERDGEAHANSALHDTNLIFATSYGEDDHLTEALRIAHNGELYASRRSNPGILNLIRKDTATMTDDGLGTIIFTALEATEGIHTGIVSGSMVGGCAIQAFSFATWDASNQAGSYLTFSTTNNSETARSERLRITYGGKLGINSTDPKNRLQVDHAGADSDDGIMIVRADSTTADGDLLGGIGFDSIDGNVPSSITEASCFIAAYASEDHGISNKGGDLVFGTTTNDDNDDITSHEWMRILDSGMVGIGATAPRNKLQISHSGADGDDGIMIVRKDLTTANGDLLGGIGFDSTDGNYPSTITEASCFIAAYAAEAHGTSDKGGDLVFGTTTINDDDDTTSHEWMRILDSGNIGIGTTGPLCKLDVEDYSNSSATLRIAGDTANQTNAGCLLVYNDNAAMTSGDVTVKIVHNDATTSGAMYFIAFYTDSTLVGGIDAEVVYDTFTAAHPTDIEDSKLAEVSRGMILKSTGEIFYRQDGISNAWCATEATTTAKDKAVVGVYNKPSAWGSPSLDGEIVNESPTGRQLHMYNALGEGQILVTDVGGNIETGDYICSSNYLGHGMLQDDDLLHNYTVAKATESIDWSTVDVDIELGYKSVLIACTYHAG